MVLQDQTQQLIGRWIEPHPWRHDPAEARLRDRKISVWAIIGHLGGDDGDLQQAADDYDIPVEAVEAAVAYYRQHRAAIDARLAQNMG